MNKAFWAAMAAIVFTCATVLGGGTISLNNYDAAKLVYWTHGVPATGGDIFGQVLAGPTIDQLVPLASVWNGTTQFSISDGYFDNGTANIPGVADNGMAYVVLRVWKGFGGFDAASAKTQISWQQQAGNNPPPPNLPTIPPLQIPISLVINENAPNPVGVGTISLNNYDANKPVYWEYGVLANASDIFGQVLAGPTFDQLVPLASAWDGTTQFSISNGYFDNGTASIPGVGDNGMACVVLRVWKGSGGFEAASAKTQISWQQNAGNNPPPPNFPNIPPLRIPYSLVINEINSLPVLAPIGDKSVSEGALLSFTATATDADLPAHAAMQSLSFSLGAGAPSGAAITSNGVFSWTPSELQGPTVNLVTIRVSDGLASVSQSFTIIVNEVNILPILAAIPNKTADENTLLSFAATATDSDLPAQMLTFSLDAGAPAGAAITPGGLFSWTPSEAQGPSTNLVTIRVSDGMGSISQTFTIIVNEINSAPVLAVIGNKTLDENTLLSFTSTATDSDLPAQTLTFSLDAGAPAGAAITAGGLFSWSPSEVQGPSTNVVTIRVSDGMGSNSQTFTIVVNDVNSAPVLAAIGNKAVDENTLLSFTATATDSDLPVQTLTFSLDAGAPTGAVITAGGLFSWTPSEAQGPSTNLVTIRVSDSVTSVSQTITIVINEINSAPVLAVIPNKTVDENTLLSFTATATDSDLPAQTLTFSLDAGAPAGAAITAGGLFSWTPSEAQGPSTNLVTIRVSDSVTSVSQAITIVVNEINSAPVLAAIPNKTVDENTLISFTAAATDADLPVQKLKFSLNAGAPVGAAITPGGLFSWTPSKSQAASTNSFTITVADDGNPVLSDSKSFVVVVNKAGDAPSIAQSPQSQTVETGADVTLSLSATGTAPLRYQWRFNGADIPAASDTSLLLSKISLSQAGRYDVVVSNDFGAATSDVALLTVVETARFAGVGMDGYIANGTVFFDANRNGQCDAGEPTTVTDTSGRFDLHVPVAEFDKNHNGQLDTEEGCLVIVGGMDIATGQPLRTSMTAPAGATVVNSLTTLMQEVLDQNPGLSKIDAESQVKTALGLSDQVPLTHYDPFASAFSKDPLAISVLNAAAQVQDTKVQMTALLEGASSGMDAEQISQQVTAALVDRMQAQGHLDLADTTTIGAVLTQVASDVNAIVAASDTLGAAKIIAGSNLLKEEAAQTDDSAAAAREISRIQGVSQGSTSDALASVGAKTSGIDDAILDNTGAGLAEKVQSAPVGDVTGQDTRMGEFSFSQTAFRILEDGQGLSAVTVNRANGNQGAVHLVIAIADGTATYQSGDYLTNAISVQFADGEISKTIEFQELLNDDTLPELDETLNLTLSLVEGAQATLAAPNKAVLTIVDNDSPGVFAFSAAAYEVHEDGSNVQDIVITRNGGSAGEVTLVVTPKSLTGQAVPDLDYVSAPIQVKFLSGNMNRLVQIPVMKDLFLENDEKLNLVLSFQGNPPPRAALGTQTMTTLTIIDDPSMAPIPTLALQPMKSDKIFRFNTVGAQGQKSIVQTSTNLIEWHNWLTNSIGAEPVEIPINKSTPRGFYRIILLK